jgi:hypothetical protein
MTVRPDLLACLEEVALGARFLASLPLFLRRRVTLEEARVTLLHRLEHREADFLSLAARAIYRYPGSPYHNLLSLAGCEYGDLEKLVGQEGVEGALQVLYRRGVYLTVDEFKGRRPVLRGSATLAIDPTRLRNPDSAFHLLGQSSGSRGTRTVVPVDLAAIRDWAINYRLFLDAYGATNWRHAVWAVPGGTTMIILLLNAIVGAPPVRWFTQIDPAAPRLHPRYPWSDRALRWGSTLARVPLPGPVHVPLDDPLPIACWMAEVLRCNGTPRLSTFASSAVRLCQAAAEAGIDLHGAQFTMFGESTTSARLAAVRRAGVAATPGYGSVECGIIGYGCLASTAPDDLHLFHDLHAMIQPAADTAESRLPPRTLLVSSLRRTAQFILVNVSLGDEAELVRRACGCPLERHGWTTHLHTIRSFEKVTAGGMTFRDADVIRVLEEVLPGRFGGGPTHYQLLEEEAEDGGRRVRLLVHPAVGPLDTEAVAEAFLAALGSGSDAEKVMTLQWRGAGLLHVERVAPRVTGGKILHLHQAPRPAGARAERPA